MARIISAVLLALLAVAALAPAAEARTRVFVGVNAGFGPYPYYPHHRGYYGAPAYYYGPPPVYYAPPPPVVYYQPPPVYRAPSNCRTWNGDADVDATGQPFYGTACLGADGRWHIVN